MPEVKGKSSAAWQQEYSPSDGAKTATNLDGVGGAEQEPVLLSQLKHVGDVTDIQVSTGRDATFQEISWNQETVSR